MSRKGTKTQTEPISWRKAMNLLELMKDKGDDNTRLMLACGFYLGLRVSDILTLRWEDILGEKLNLQEQKTGKAREITFDEGFKDVRDEVWSVFSAKKQPLPTQYIFTHQRIDGDQNKPISVVAANKRIKKAFKQYDITCKNPSSHTLRKTFGRRIYEVYNQCEDALILLSQVFNHRDISITRRYIGITERRIANAYMSLSDGKARYE